MRSLALATVALVLLVTAPPRADAQVGYGAQLNFADDFDFGVGGHLLFGTEQVLEGTRLSASFDYYFPDDDSDLVDVNFWEINVNGHWFVPLENSPVRLYVGPGLHIARVSVDVENDTVFGGEADDTELGLNVLGGIEIPVEAAVTPFAELKIELGGAEQFVLTAGLRF